MPPTQAPLDYLRRFIPPIAVPKILHYLHHYAVHLTITRDRKSVLGDYRHPTHQHTHRISVNSTLNPYAFLITLIHELAHLVTFMQYGHKVPPHGNEWKSNYATLLKDFMDMRVFPDDIHQALNHSLDGLPASSCSDDRLMRILRKYDNAPAGQVLIEQLPEGSVFEIGQGRLFRKGKKLRKRYQCVELQTGREYLFSPVFEVTLKENA
jgi:SprT protein